MPFVVEAEAKIGGSTADGCLLLQMMQIVLVMMVEMVLHDRRRQRSDVMRFAKMPLRWHHVAAGFQAGLHHLECVASGMGGEGVRVVDRGRGDQIGEREI